MITLPAVPGRVYFLPCSPTTLLVAANTFYAVPFIAPKASRGFNQMGIRVTTAGAGAGADVRLALYVDADGRPGDLINAFGPITGLTAPGAYGVDSVSTPRANCGSRVCSTKRLLRCPPLPPRVPPRLPQRPSVRAHWSACRAWRMRCRQA